MNENGNGIIGMEYEIYSYNKLFKKIKEGQKVTELYDQSWNYSYFPPALNFAIFRLSP